MRPPQPSARTLSVLLALLALLAAPPAVEAATESGPRNGGTLRVDGRSVELVHGYLFSVPDAFAPEQRNAVVLLVPRPLDAARLAAAKTLAEVTALAGEHALVEIAPDRKGQVSLCHDAFGRGNCYRAPLSAFEPHVDAVAADRAAGRVRSFGGAEETVLERHRLRFELRFDLTGGRRLGARR